MTAISISCKGLGKQYRIGQRESYRALRDVLGDALRAPFRKRFRADFGNQTNKIRSDGTFWALDNVSFEVKQGEVIGIIGRNGAGKSTLLKVLSRITKPTKGSVRINGRVASLLEVGTGFHPELTGRENIFLNGAILGMRKAEIKRKFDEIVAFAEIDKFIDTPVKRYSSGMYVRLAFAVAAHLEPEILLVDEVLAVGDAAFQHKCLGQLNNIANSGRTVLFVSHNMGAVRTLCSRGILLAGGRVELEGNVQEAVAAYANQLLLSEPLIDLTERKVGRSGPGQLCRITNVALLNDKDCPSLVFPMGSEIKIRIGLDFKSRGTSWEIGIGIVSNSGVQLHCLISNWEGFKVQAKPGPTVLEVNVPQIQLFPGRYSIVLWVKRPGETIDDQINEAIAFDVEESDITGHPAYFTRYSYNTQVYIPHRWQQLS